MSARSEVDEMTDFARRELGRIGVLINNAGIAQQKMFCDITEQDFDRMMGVTVKGAFNCIQAALPDMVQDVYKRQPFCLSARSPQQAAQKCRRKAAMKSQKRTHKMMRTRYSCSPLRRRR